MDLAYGLNADITVKVKIPKGDWSSLRKGGGRGKIGYKDDVLKWYAGGYIDLIGAGVEIASPSGMPFPYSLILSSMSPAFPPVSSFPANPFYEP